ncbi:MAG: hypothetical protein ACXWT4_15585 [Methylobacter sp.]
MSSDTADWLSEAFMQRKASRLIQMSCFTLRVFNGTDVEYRSSRNFCIVGGQEFFTHHYKEKKIMQAQPNLEITQDPIKFHIRHYFKALKSRMLFWALFYGWIVAEMTGGY